MNIIAPFTENYGEIKNVIKTECAICEAYNPNISKGAPPKNIKYVGLWDTGAMSSVVTRKVINDLNLKPSGGTFVRNTSGIRFEQTYKINILLPSKVGVSFLDVTEGILTDFDVLIGMDVICRGDFAISNSNNETTFTFQIPATHKIDFEKELYDKLHTPIKVDKTLNRNDPCFCGSGKKYKNCCFGK